MQAFAKKSGANTTASNHNKGGADFFGIQAKLSVGKPNDKYEAEADQIADQVIKQKTVPEQGFSENPAFFRPAPAVQKQNEEEKNDSIQKKEAPENNLGETIQSKEQSPTISAIQFQREIGSFFSRPKEDQVRRKEEDKENEEEQEETVPVQEKSALLQRKEKGVPDISSTIESRIQRANAGGKPMNKDVKGYMEPRFQTDFSKVKIHDDQEAASLNSQLSAKAFTHKNHVFFGKGQYQPGTDSGKHLIAHELTHVVQQGHAVQRKPDIKEKQPNPKVQRLGVSDALDYFADKAYLIPGFRMFTIVLGINPINMSNVDRSAANIMRAIVEFLPGGNLITRVLDKYNVFEKAAGFMKEQLDTLNISGRSIKDAIDEFLDSLGWSDIFDLGDVWRRAKRIFTSPITKLINLGKSVLSAIIDMVREAVLRPLAALAEGTRGYPLLKAILGEDPITKEPYPPTPENVIGGFMTLIGQEEIWENIKKGNAVARAWAWFQGALSGLMAFVVTIPATIINTLKSLTWDDFIILPNAFIKIGKSFVNIAGRFISWAAGTVLDLLEILFSVVAPGVMPYIKKAKGAFATILQNPIAFVGNLIKAAKQGFQQFAAKIGHYLKKSLLDWLLGSLAGAGIYVPQSFDFKEIIKFVASVLGLTWENLRIKLVKHLGEPAVKALETGFELIQILVTEGPAAAWEKIMEHLSNLKEMVIQEISQFVIVQVVKKAIAKLVMSLNPAGAIIQAILAIYDTITFLIEKIKQIARVGAAVIDSIAAIANGVITQAANKVEKTLAGMLTLAINFLAKFAGLGKISEAIIKIIKKIREPVDKAMDKVVGWIVNKGKAFLKKAAQTGVPKDPKDRLEVGLSKAVGAVNKLSGSSVGIKLINPILTGIKTRYGFKSLIAVKDGEFWAIEGQVNPKGKKKSNKKAGGNKLGPDDAEIIAEVAKIKSAPAFKGKTFKMITLKSYIEANYDIKSRTIDSRIAKMKSLGLLFVSESEKAGAKDSNKDVSFDASLLSAREAKPVTNRNKYGYRNPNKASSKGIQILVKGLMRESRYGYKAGKETDLNYLMTRARFKDSLNNISGLKWDQVILGHGSIGASVHWNSGGGSGPNQPGHTQTKDQNFQWNQNVANYHGPEDKYKSKASGAGTENYQTPGPPNNPDSHPMWWDPKDPNYQG
ncbi:DUF4157 domain-containing protein [Sinomicrobium kalidii]|uniref:eCIS core domain-containing protein n=1 Tax=Sinomicrobium kalidii TaxID=2900738 RepID=UPI001E37CAE9|nr:DUF4157 domain-containing protein [Sinomicrobium kalidii]UGU16058.1 DUF4157 domain-containing protein [Sinomicrobium kalidii]